MTSREEILAKIRDIKTDKKFEVPEKPDLNKESLAPIKSDLVDVFKQELEAVSGSCVVLNSDYDVQNAIADYLKTQGVASLVCVDDKLEFFVPDSCNLVDLLNAEAAIISCDTLIARTGSVFVSSKIAKSRRIQVFPPIVLVVAYENQIVPYLKQGIDVLKARYSDDWPSQISLITGPSRTADIEKTLVLGAHGPKELAVFIIKDK